MFKKFAIIAIATTGVLAAASCTPEEIAALNAASPEDQAAVIAGLQARESAKSRDCNEAIDRHFSGDKARMKKIVWRESRNNPTVANTKSHARGCSQLMLTYHAHLFAKVGCPDIGSKPWRDTSKQWADPDCNIKAANLLYDSTGWRPWALTNY